MMEVSTTAIVVLACVIVVIIMLIVSRRKEKSSRNAIDRVAPELGLSPVSTPEPLFLDRISRLYRRSDADMEIANVFCGDRREYRIHLFDLLSRDKDPDSPVIVNSVVSVSSLRLYLPRFSLHPKLDFKGLLGSALSKALNRRISATPPEGMTKVAAGSHPEFDRKYVLFGVEPAEVRKRFADRILTHLARREWYMIEAGADTLTSISMVFDAERLGGRINGEKIKDLVHDAERLYELFRA